LSAGIGQDESGAGYVRMLKRQWGGGPRLVRIECRSTLWFWARRGLDLTNAVLEWKDGEIDLLWTAGGSNMIWGDGSYALRGTGVEDGDWFALEVAGFPPNRTVARPSELIRMTTVDAVQEAYVLTVAKSDASGTAIVRTDRSTAFEGSGLVSIGHKESGVFEVLSLPRAVQPVSGVFGYEWSLREVFEDEYPDGFEDVNPWT
tara:strand:- start:7986 stop:8594 length:609 start_codon:yes stop_codon:yes gene_type:complete